MEEINISFSNPTDESLVARLDREQVATDIGKIAKMLALSSMMLSKTQLLDKNSNLDKYSQLIRHNAEQITAEIIGEEWTEFKNGDYRKYYPNVPDSLDRYVDYAGMIVAKLMDGVMASKFVNEENLNILYQRLEEINKIVSDFNSYANNIHKIADITYIDKNKSNIK